MGVQYVVPPIAQHSSDTCWHAAAMMIWQYSQGVSGRQGPMNTLARAYEANRSITAWARLARKAGMKAVPAPLGFLQVTDIERLLVNHGPLWCAGYWYGPGHVIVLTGVDDDYVYLNDPDGGVKKKETIAWFNLKVMGKWPGAVAYKDPAAY